MNMLTKVVFVYLNKSVSDCLIKINNMIQYEKIISILLSNLESYSIFVSNTESK